MPLVSSKVAAGIAILADHFNKLREDLTTNHDHSTGKGGTVEHGNLSDDVELGSLGHRHEDIDVHLLGGGPGPNSIDTPGGSQGVHGLDADSYVVGGYDSQWVIECGTATMGSGSGDVSVDVDFNASFSTTPFVFCTWSQAPIITTPTDAESIYVTGRDNEGFTANCHEGDTWGNKQFMWVAFGTV